MLPEKIKKFYETRVEYFKKKEEIARVMCELDLLLMEANQNLKDTVDNGFDDEYLIKVSKAYSKHKFNSKIVYEFLDKIDDMFFKDLEPELKDTLEVVSINIELDYGNNWEESCKEVSGPVQIDIHSSLSNRLFRIFVPTKSSISTDMIHWTNRCDGMYIVKANSINTNKSKDICRVFDQSKIVDAIRKYLKGEFDHELDYEVFSFNGKSYSVYRTAPYAPRYSSFTSWSYDSSEYENNAKYIEVHDLFNDSYATESRFDKLEDIVSDCICDIEEFDVKKVDS